MYGKPRRDPQQNSRKPHLYYVAVGSKLPTLRHFCLVLCLALPPVVDVATTESPSTPLINLIISSTSLSFSPGVVAAAAAAADVDIVLTAADAVAWLVGRGDSDAGDWFSDPPPDSLCLLFSFYIRKMATMERQAHGEKKGKDGKLPQVPGRLGGGTITQKIRYTSDCRTDHVNWA